ncbi:MAG: acyl-CoA dehydrogenase family protein [Burkholderiaceae bacterium]|nr:acyl-CoA dehydrogenase family protein [Burkholderiaceae bacterium]
MWTYNAPLRDMHFVIEEVLKAPDDWAQTPAFTDLDADTSRQILEEAAKFATGVLAPINSAADLEGCKWVDGAVTTPQGYPAAYKAFVEGGWPALACDPEYGGQGLPALINAALNEMIAAANHGWTMYPGLLHGAYDCIKTHGSEALKARYLDKVVSGEWLATMNLTEPQAGSDLGQVRAKVEAGPMTEDGASWLISGTKIFISGGDQDMTDNIVHLVLCRLPDAPAGSKGLSLMLAPKFLPDGSRNAIRCDGIEKKMGIKGSATCVMSFEGATGWLVGEPHRGLAAMFVMMNSARLHVGVQGLGHLEMAQQNAHAYARERVQGRNTVIEQHPAVRRTLWSLRALTEGERVVAYWTAQLLDEAHQHPDAARRARADGLVALLTPVAKAFFTDNGNRGANEALQVWGGYGYVHEYGIEQTVRDSRIAMIYEGTNEIQAIDLLQRKVLDDGGAKLLSLLTVLEQEVERCSVASELTEFSTALNGQIAATREALGALLAARQADPEWSLRVADDFLRGLGLTLLAWAWACSARVALPQSADVWYAEKVKAARFGVQWLLPEANWRWQRVLARGAALPAIAAN